MNDTFPMIDFESYIKDHILDRGLTYYLEDRVKLISKEKNHVIATVRGQRTYQVVIDFVDEEMVEQVACNCPYDQGGYCKHIAAVFYALMDLDDSIEFKDHTVHPDSNEAYHESLIDSTKLVTHIKKLRKNEIIELMMKIGSNHPLFIKDLWLAVTPPESIQITHKTIVDPHFDAYSFHTSDAIDYYIKLIEKIEQQDGFQAIQNLMNLYHLMEHKHDDFFYEEDEYTDYEQNELPFDIFIETLTKKASEVIDFVYDEEIYQTFEIIKLEILRLKSEGRYDEVFGFLSIVTQFGVYKEFIPEIENLFDQFTLTNRSHDMLSYQIIQIMRLRYTFVKQYQGADLAQAYAKKHLSIIEMKVLYLDSCIELNNYQEVINVLESEFIRVKDSSKSTLWGKYLYEAYKNLGHIEHQKDIAGYLVEKGETDFYYVLKALTEPSEWEDVIDQLIKKVQSAMWSFGTYKFLLIEEKRWDELMMFCDKHPREIFGLYEHFGETYKTKMSELFEVAITEEIDHGQNRSYYENRKPLFKKYKRACGKSVCDAFILKLKETYHRRPALKAVLDELLKY